MTTIDPSATVLPRCLNLVDRGARRRESFAAAVSVAINITVLILVPMLQPVGAVTLPSVSPSALHYNDNSLVLLKAPTTTPQIVTHRQPVADKKPVHFTDRFARIAIHSVHTVSIPSMVNHTDSRKPASGAPAAAASSGAPQTQTNDPAPPTEQNPVDSAGTPSVETPSASQTENPSTPRDFQLRSGGDPSASEMRSSVLTARGRAEVADQDAPHDMGGPQLRAPGGEPTLLQARGGSASVSEGGGSTSANGNGSHSSVTGSGMASADSGNTPGVRSAQSGGDGTEAGRTTAGFGRGRGDSAGVDDGARSGPSTSTGPGGNGGPGVSNGTNLQDNGIGAGGAAKTGIGDGLTASAGSKTSETGSGAKVTRSTIAVGDNFGGSHTVFVPTGKLTVADSMRDPQLAAPEEPVIERPHPVDSDPPHSGVSAAPHGDKTSAFTEAIAIVSPKPRLPEEARGDVVRPVKVEFTISANGGATARIIQHSGSAAADAAVEATVRNWRWQAATRGGTAVERRQVVAFTLD